MSSFKTCSQHSWLMASHCFTEDLRIEVLLCQEAAHSLCQPKHDQRPVTCTCLPIMLILEEQTIFTDASSVKSTREQSLINDSDSATIRKFHFKLILSNLSKTALIAVTAVRTRLSLLVYRTSSGSAPCEKMSVFLFLSNEMRFFTFFPPARGLKGKPQRGKTL